MAETNNTPTTIQQSLEEAWSAFVGHDVAIQGASRTDAGVHARGQLAAVTVQHPAQLCGMIKAVNTKLTRQIAVRLSAGPPRLQPSFWKQGQGV